jgi:hypothetical protein
MVPFTFFIFLLLGSGDAFSCASAHALLARGCVGLPDAVVSAALA